MVRAFPLSSYRGPATAGLVAGAALLTAMLTAVVVGDQQSEIGLYLVAAATFLFCLVYWRPAVYGVFLVLFVEGYLRNYLGNPNVLLFKDLMLAAIYLRVFGGRLIERRPIIPSTPINVPLAVFAAIVFIQTLNPYVFNREQAMIGVRTWLFYVPLYYVAQEMLQTEQEIRRFVWFFLGCAVPICAVAINQFRLGPEAYASQGEGFVGATFVTAGSSGWIYRPNATFSWGSHFATFLSIVILLSVGMLLGTPGRRRGLLWGLVALLVGVELIEGQRTSYLLLAPAVGLVLTLRGKLRAVPIAVLTLIVVMVVVGQLTESAGLERVRELTENRGDVFGARAEDYLNYSITALQQAPMGRGAGATSLGTRYVAEEIPLYLELPLAKIIGDLSLVGLVAYFWLLGSLCLASFRAHARAARAGASSCAGLLAAILVYQMLGILGSYELAIQALPLWFLSGAAASLAAIIADPPDTCTGPADVVSRAARGASR